MVSLIVLKLVAASSIVLVATLVAEYVDPKLAGKILGLPIITGTSLLFIALENNSGMAAQAAVYVPLGLASDLIFVYGYVTDLKGYGALVPRSGPGKIFFSMLMALAGYSFSVLLFNQPGFEMASSMVVLLFISLLTHRMFSVYPETKVSGKEPPNPAELLLRIFMASSVILFATYAAKSFGPGLAGLISAFPTTIIPTFVILDLKYGQEAVKSCSKTIPLAFISSAVYSLSVNFFYLQQGIIYGTLVSAILCLASLMLIENLAIAFSKLSRA